MDLQEARNVAQGCENFFRAFEKLREMLAVAVSLESTTKDLQGRIEKMQMELAGLNAAVDQRRSTAVEDMKNIARQIAAKRDEHQAAMREMTREKAAARQEAEAEKLEAKKAGEAQALAFEKRIAELRDHAKQAERDLASIRAAIAAAKEKVGALE